MQTRLEGQLVGEKVSHKCEQIHPIHPPLIYGGHSLMTEERTALATIYVECHHELARKIWPCIPPPLPRWPKRALPGVLVWTELGVKKLFHPAPCVIGKVYITIFRMEEYSTSSAM